MIRLSGAGNTLSILRITTFLGSMNTVPANNAWDNTIKMRNSWDNLPHYKLARATGSAAAEEERVAYVGNHYRSVHTRRRPRLNLM